MDVDIKVCGWIIGRGDTCEGNFQLSSANFDARAHTNVCITFARDIVRSGQFDLGWESDVENVSIKKFDIWSDLELVCCCDAISWVLRFD